MVQVLLSNQKAATNERVLEILFDSDEITWKSMIFGLIQSEEMDPWDIDVSIIANKFLSVLKKLKDLDFRVSGKFVLASAVLLKLKSDKLMDEELVALENLINSVEEPMNMGFFDEFPVDYPMDALAPAQEKPKLVPKTPQPRKRKVSVYDLVKALEEALEPEARRPPRKPAAYKDVAIPMSHVDISEVIKDVYNKINTHYAAYPQRKQRLSFNEILPSEDKQDKVMTFIPLLHLDNQRKIDVLQEEHFGSIEIDLLMQDADLEEIAFAAQTAKS